MSEWNLIVDKIPLKGSWNMAVDDFLFQSLGEEPQTYVRFYAWKKPTVSLGYSQKIFKVLDIEYCQKNGIDIVRRITGGKLVLHYKEVTYSICSSDKEIFTSTLDDSYRIISEALMCGLGKMGLKPCLADAAPSSYVRGNLPCFSYPARNEVEIDGKKIIGSAQKREGSKFIQHGSIPLEGKEELLKSVSFLKGREENIRMISVSQALDKRVAFDWVVNLLVEGISEYFKVHLKPKDFSMKNREDILNIQRERYESKDWLYR